MRIVFALAVRPTASPFGPGRARAQAVVAPLVQAASLGKGRA